MPGTRGFDGLLELRGLYPKMPIVVVSALEDPRIIQEVMSYGAAGFIPKSIGRDELAAALKLAMEGSVTLPKGYNPPEPAKKSGTGKTDLAQRLQTLTPKQLSVLKMLRQGLLNKQIAHELKIEETTVKAHVSEILRKLNVASRTQAVIEAQKINFDTILEVDAGELRPKTDHFTRCCISARNSAGLTGLCSTSQPDALAASVVSLVLSAVIRMAGMPLPLRSRI